jgi:hypothetical protein
MMIYHFSFILLKAFVGRIFSAANERRENFNKFFACDSRLNDAFFPPEKNISVRLTKKTHKKSPPFFDADPFVKSDEIFSRFFW